MEIQNSHKHIKLVMNGTEYGLTLYLSVKDIMFLVETDNEASDRHPQVIASIMRKHIINNDSIPSDEFIAMDDAALIKYIEELVSEDSRLRNSYEKFSYKSNIYLKFVLVTKDMWNNMTRSVVSQLPQITKPLALDIGKTTLAVSSQIGSTLSSFEKLIPDIDSYIG